MFEGKKITRATFKSFVRKNLDNLFIQSKSNFDGMYDCVMPCEDKGWSKTVSAQYPNDNNLGIQGIWLVCGGSARDYFTEVKRDGFVGIEVWNCCGSFVVGILEGV